MNFINFVHIFHHRMPTSPPMKGITIYGGTRHIGGTQEIERNWTLVKCTFQNDLQLFEPRISYG